MFTACRTAAVLCLAGLSSNGIGACASASDPPAAVTVPPPARPARLAPDAQSQAARCPATVPRAASHDDPDASLEPLVPASECSSLDEGTLGSVERALLVPAPPDRSALPFAPWDHVTTPARLEDVARRLALSPDERAMLSRQGFVVPARLDAADYVLALHEVFQSELPLYVSVDAVLSAIYASNDRLIATVESAELVPLLTTVLDRMHRALPAAAVDYPPEVAADVDTYLTVARRLLEGPAKSALGDDAAADRLVALAEAAGPMAAVDVFGRSRIVDFSAYKPRGHYARVPTGSEADPSDAPPDLRAYFRAAMWLSRLELNLVTRSCPSSSPAGAAADTSREATDAVALADLADRAGALCDITRLDQAWGLLAGAREDVSVEEVAALSSPFRHGKLTVESTARQLAAAIGDRFQRTTLTQYAYEGCGTQLPVVHTMLGARVVPDTTMLAPLVHGQTVDRQMLGPADVAYSLGHDRALPYLAGDLATFPDLRKQLDVARAIAAAPVRGTDLYSTWFRAVRGLGSPAPGETPSFMRTDAFRDLRLNSTVAAFGELRHNYVLMAAQLYSEAGCDIPDGFVEPAPAVYDALVAYADRGAEVMAVLDAGDTTGAIAYFRRTGRILRVLRAIGDDELANRPLSADARRFLSMVVEITEGTHGTGGSPRFGGWYLDLFRDYHEAFGSSSFVADYFTSSDTGDVAHVGVHGVKLGVFVVDTAGPPRVVVGPVADAYGYTGSHGTRLTDEEALHLPDASRERPWAFSYTVAAPPEPPLTVRVVRVGPGKDDRAPPVTLELSSSRALGPVSVELVDHHRRPRASATVSVSATPARLTLHPAPAPPDDSGYEGIHVHAGSFDAFVLGTDDPTEGNQPLRVSTGVVLRFGGMRGARKARRR